MPSEPMAMMRSTSPERDRLLARARPRRRPPSPRRCCRRTPVLRPVRREARRLVAAPDDDVGRRLDLLDLVAVDRASCSRRSRAPCCRPRAQRLADREQHGVAEAAADQQHGLARLAISVGVPVGPIEDHRLAGLEQRAEIRRAAHLQHDRRQQALVACRPRRRSAPGLPWPAACRRPAATSVS